MLDRVTEEARERGTEDTPTKQCVLGGVQYHVGMSFCWINPFSRVCYVDVHD
jgi:hypothetical protein